MIMIFDTYTVYVFPDSHNGRGVKRLSCNLAALTLKQLTLKYGKPTKVTYSYERVMQEGIR